MREAASKEAEARKAGWRNPDASEKTWGEWQREWWPTRSASEATLKSELCPLNKHLMPRWERVPLNAITRHDIKAWIADLLRGEPDPDDPDAWQKKPLAPGSVQRYFAIFGSSLTAAVDAEVIDYDPSHKIKIPKGETDERRFLTRAEADKLLNQFSNTRDLAVVMTLLGTGMRWGEAMGLQIERVDFSMRRVRIAETWVTKTGKLKAFPKGRRMRYVPLPDWLSPILDWAIGGRKAGYVFTPTLDINNWRKRVWDGAVEAAAIGHVRIHDLRHTYASWRIQGGVPLAEVGQLLGHADWKTTQTYAHLEDQFSEEVRASADADSRMAFAWQSGQATHGFVSQTNASDTPTSL